MFVAAPLDPREIRRGAGRTIGLLTIVTELISDTVDWVMNSRAPWAGSGYTVDGFPGLRNDHHAGLAFRSIGGSAWLRWLCSIWPSSY